MKKIIFALLFLSVIAVGVNASGIDYNTDPRFTAPTDPGDSGGGGGNNGGGENSGGGNTGGGETGNNGGGNQGTPNIDSEAIAIGQETTALTTKVNESEAEFVGLPVPSDGNVDSSEIMTDVSNAISEGIEAAESAMSDPEANANKSANAESQEAESMAGDPVSIASGEYFLEDSDIKNVTRNYTSQNSITGSFGYGWYSNLDEVILVGSDDYSANPRTLYDEKCLSVIEENISDLEARVLSEYDVSSIEFGKMELGSRKGVLQNFRNGLKVELEKANNLIGRASGRSIYYTLLPLRDRIQAMIDDCNARISIYETQCAKFDEYALIQMFLAMYQADARNKSEGYGIQFAENSAEEAKNNLSKKSGMASYYHKTGRGTLTFVDEKAVPHLFEKNESGKFVPRSKSQHNLISIAVLDSGYELLMKGGQKKVFDKNGLLIKIIDRNENCITINRNANGNVETLKTSFGENYSFTYNGDFISAITKERNPDFKVIYSYSPVSSSGKTFLSSVTDEEGDVVTFDYTNDGHLVKINKNDGSKIQIDYNVQAADGNILTTSTTNEQGFSETFEYNKASRKTLYTDHDGNETEYLYDENHRTVYLKTPDGSETYFSYDDEGNCIKEEINGNTINYSYNDSGDRIRADYSDGSFEQWRYDDFSLLTEYVDRDGVASFFNRDEHGNETGYILGGKTVRTLKYDSKGLLLEEVFYGENARKTSYSYDEFGNLTKRTVGGRVEEFSYDVDDRITKISVNGREISSYEYGNKTITKNDYNGKKTIYTRNGRKDLVRIEEIDTYTGEKRITRYEYDKRHLPIKMYFGGETNQPLVWECRYTHSGLPLAEMFPNGDESYVTYFIYSGNEISQAVNLKVNKPISNFQSVDLGELKNTADDVYIKKYEKQIEYNNQCTMKFTDEIGRVHVFKFDSFGNNYEYQNPLSESFTKNFSSAGKLLSQETEYGGFYDFSYDGQGNLLESGERNKEKISIGRYDDGSVSYTVNRYGEKTYYSYNNLGQITCVSSPGRTVWYSYDDFGRPTQLVVGQENNAAASETYIRYEYSYDGRTVTMIEGGLYESTYELNAFGEIVKQTDGNDNSIKIDYDAKGNEVGFTDGYGNTAFFEYNCFGDVTKMIDFDGSEKNYLYDAASNLIKITDSIGTVWEGSYDKAGRLVSEKGRPGIDKSYEYDELDRLKVVKTGDVVTESYSYSSKGREITFTDGNGNDYRYSKDDFGRIMSETNRDGVTQNFSFDAEGALKSQVDFGGNETRIIRSDGATEITYSFHDGTKSIFSYNMSGDVVRAVNESAEISYEYDKSGRLVSATDETGGSVLRYMYDNAGNKTRLESNNCDLVYTYGRNNEVLSIYDNKQRISVEFTYDKCGRETSRTFGNGVVQSTLYDEAGRVILVSEKDFDRKLIRAEGYVYDSVGRQIAKITDSGSVTLFEYDTLGHISKVYYPLSKGLEDFQRREAEENGLPTENVSVGEGIYLSADLYGKLNSLLSRMGGSVSSVSLMQPFNVESYSYDRCNNRITKTTSYGTIEYNYSVENRLVSSGAKDRDHCVFYKYDLNGNLLEKYSPFGKSEYAYNASNRMKSSQVIDEKNRTMSQVCYEYDGFGRRTVVQDSDSSAMRMLYDGFSFDIVKKSPTHPNGRFVDVFSDGFQDSAYSLKDSPINSRSLYIDDKSSVRNKSYFDDSSYILLEDDSSEQIFISQDGSPLAASQLSDTTSRTRGAYYYGTDMYGSVRSETNLYGESLGGYDYDVFGNLLSGGDVRGSGGGFGVGFGYCGKSYSRATGLLDYGYRDYAPSVGRFTTVDPIRDGVNWFGYCDGDAVNWVDRLGLELILTVDKETQTMKVQLEIPGHNYETEFFITTAVVSHDPTKVTNPEKTNTNGSPRTQFPNGTWKLTGTGKATQPSDADEKPNYFGEIWITTNATQVLPDGNGGEVVDGGYYIHLTSCSNTAGCVGLPYEDNGESNMNLLLMLYNYNEAMDPGSGKIVVKGNPQKASKEKIENRNKHKQKAWSYKEWKAKKEAKDKQKAENAKKAEEKLEALKKAGKIK